MNINRTAPAPYWAVALLMLIIMTGTDAKSPAPENQPVDLNKALQVREPAVAGLFYPKDPDALSRTIDGFIEAASAPDIPHLKAIICPHAGYAYSGPVAAHAYKLLIGRDIKTVILLAPSHYAWFEGAFVSPMDVFRTPLGDVPISPKAKELALHSPFSSQVQCRVQPPSWASHSSRSTPNMSEETPDTWEHADEVQVPFLQKTLKSFDLIPIVIGEADAEAVANGLANVMDDHTMLVISSDLSHYHPYDKAKKLDNHCIESICAMDFAQMKSQEACGKRPILVLMHLAKQKGWKPHVLDYRNSGDTSSDKSGVVGYAALAFALDEPASAANTPEGYSLTDKKYLMDLAKESLRRSVAGEDLPVVVEKEAPKSVVATKACFVTLTKKGTLRGCIGNLTPVEPLFRAVIDNARGAALHDSRFPSVQPEELSQIEVELSILTEPAPLAFSSPDELLKKLHPHKDGVVLDIHGHRSTFLPQVWEQLPDKVEFLEHLSRKSGCAPSDWRKPGVTVSIYHVEHFSEKDL